MTRRLSVAVSPGTLIFLQVGYWLSGLGLYASSGGRVLAAGSVSRMVMLCIVYAIASWLALLVYGRLRTSEPHRAMRPSPRSLRAGQYLIIVGVALEAVQYRAFIESPLFAGGSSRFDVSNSSGVTTAWPILLIAGVAALSSANFRGRVLWIAATAAFALLSGNRTTPLLLLAVFLVGARGMQRASLQATAVGCIAAAALAVSVESSRLVSQFGSAEAVRARLVGTGTWQGNIPLSVLAVTPRQTAESQMVFEALVEQRPNAALGVPALIEDLTSPLPGAQLDLGARTLRAYVLAGIPVTTSRPGGTLGTLALFGLGPLGVALYAAAQATVLAVVHRRFAVGGTAGRLLWPAVAAFTALGAYGIGTVQSTALLVILLLLLLSRWTH